MRPRARQVLPAAPRTLRAARRFTSDVAVSTRALGARRLRVVVQRAQAGTSSPASAASGMLTGTTSTGHEPIRMQAVLTVPNAVRLIDAMR